MKDAKDSLRILSLGGSSQVTKNMYVYEYVRGGNIKEILLVDCGIGFPGADMYGVDLILPDISYLEDKLDRIRGLVFTHGHDDHIGGIPYIYPKLGKIPMYATPLTAAFANIKLKEAKIATRVKDLNFDSQLNLGLFRVRFVHLTHSVPDTANLVIETPVGSIYHGSDFKFDLSPLDGQKPEISKIVNTGSKGVLCLLTDSLGSERRGFTVSEKVIGDTLERELSFCQGRFFFTTQSSNISRIQLAIEKGIKFGRKIAFMGRSIDQNVEAALQLGYMNFPRELIINTRNLKNIPPAKQFIIIAGSQGQQDSALSRVAVGGHPFAKVNRGDTVVISSDPIPGNEENINTMIEQLFRTGAHVSYTNITEDLHVSGHGSQCDLMLLLSMLGPKYVIPIGGTYRHMIQYRKLAVEMGYEEQKIIILDEGEIIEFKSDQQPRVVETTSIENVMIDGLGVGDVGKIVLRDRRTIANEGIVVVIVPVEKNTGKILSEPDIVSRGFVYIRESTQLINETKKVILKSIRGTNKKIINWHFVRKDLEEQVGRFLQKETGRTPLIVPVLIEV